MVTFAYFLFPGSGVYCRGVFSSSLGLLLYCLCCAFSRIAFLGQVGYFLGYFLGVFMIVCVYGRVFCVRFSYYGYLSYLEVIVTMAREYLSYGFSISLWRVSQRRVELYAGRRSLSTAACGFGYLLYYGCYSNALRCGFCSIISMGFFKAGCFGYVLFFSVSSSLYAGFRYGVGSLLRGICGYGVDDSGAWAYLGCRRSSYSYSRGCGALSGSYLSGGYYVRAGYYQLGWYYFRYYRSFEGVVYPLFEVYRMLTGYAFVIQLYYRRVCDQTGIMTAFATMFAKVVQGS